MPRLAIVVLSLLMSVAGAALLVEHASGHQPPSRTPMSAGAAGETVSPAAERGPDESGVPVGLEIPFASSNHPDGVTASVSADPLTERGDLFVPEDPRTLSWASDDAAPGSSRGTAILVGHVNYVVDGELVRGALSDLAEYAVEHIGQTFTVQLADGRRLDYRITGGERHDKDALAARPELRQMLYDQTNAFGPAPGTGRLVLVSCGGAFDTRTGNYEDNVFVFALPVAAEARGPLAEGDARTG
ncbi:class F sortase [Blastococcus atacamensis]|uniref:class F sortase n=1 Tax=Blastococcus atacamensis TaxID=2070508 RepID=UPI000CECD882|nr:class F sortase [Blastococcus atacamensis]